MAHGTTEVTAAWPRAGNVLAALGLLVVLGGTAAVSDATVMAMPAESAARAAGPERTATSAVIAAGLWRDNGIGRGGTAVVNVRDPAGWQTALSAAVASAILDMPQIGVESPPAALGGAVTEYLATTGDTPIVGFGDAALVSNEQLIQAAQARG